MILVQNIYWMLSYAFETLNEQGYKRCAKENFDNALDLLSSILEKGLTYQVKRGVNKYYVEKQESLNTLRGKIDIQGTIQNRIRQTQKLDCIYEEFSINTYFNQIIKTTVERVLLVSKDVKNKDALKRLMVYFKDVDILPLRGINWKLHFDRNNQSYRMLLYICHLIVDGMIQSTQDGNIKLLDYIEEKHLAHLYEKFILKYYQKHFSGKFKAEARQIKWALDDENVDSLFLPEMQTDITLTNGNKVLIIDAKYYPHNSSSGQFGKKTIHSHNIYQIFTYVKNKAAEDSSLEVGGLLLYAKTDDEQQVYGDYLISGNYIGATTLDLSQDFQTVKDKLDSIGNKLYMGEIKYFN